MGRILQLRYAYSKRSDRSDRSDSDEADSDKADSDKADCHELPSMLRQPVGFCLAPRGLNLIHTAASEVEIMGLKPDLASAEGSASTQLFNPLCSMAVRIERVTAQMLPRAGPCHARKHGLLAGLMPGMYLKRFPSCPRFVCSHSPVYSS